MGVMGFPGERDLSTMFGVVTEEDRQRWERDKQASDQRIQGAREGLTARGLASKSVTPTIGLAEKVINSQIHGEMTDARRNTHRKQTKRTISVLDTEEPVQSDSQGMEF